MEFSVSISQQHWQTFNKAIRKLYFNNEQSGVFFHLKNIALWFVIGLVSVFVNRNYISFDWPTALFTSTLFIILGACIIRINSQYLKNLTPLEDGVICGTQNIELTEEGISSSSKSGHTSYPWKSAYRVEKIDGLLLVFVDKIMAFILPVDQLTDPDEVIAVIKNKKPELFLQ